MFHPHNLQLVSHFGNLALHLIVLVFLPTTFLSFSIFMILLLLKLFLHTDFRLIRKSLHYEGTLVTAIFYYMLGITTINVVNSLAFHRLWWDCPTSRLLWILAVKRKSRERGLIIIALLIILELISQLSDTFFLQDVRLWRNVSICLIMCLGETLWNFTYFKGGLAHILLHKLILCDPLCL
jgi:hypothetical protein